MNMHVRLFKTIFVTLLVLAVGLGDVENDEDDVQVEVDIEEDSKSGNEVAYTSPQISEPDRVYFAEHFDDLEQFEKKWIKSQAVKEGISEDIAKYNGEWKVEAPLRDGLIGDKGLVLKTHAKHAAISSHLTKPFVFDQKPLIVQYEVTLQDGQQCGGAYLKLLSQGPQTSNLKQFQDKTPYTIMFGPDKCGGDYKLHFIFNHRNPINGSLQEKHCKKSNERLEDLINDKWPHLYTLIINPDNSFQISIDNKLVNSGSLLEDFSPAVNPPAEVDDPNDKKPEDWDEREKIPDPEATKPEDWDEDAPSQIVDESATVPDGWLENEPAHISDPDAIRPADWDTDMDGEWEAPLIDNPACANAAGCGAWEPPLINNPAFKGKWRASLIDNPNYKGKWRPRTIANPDYFEDLTPFKMTTVSAIGFELWSMSRDMLFDNILITDEIEVATKWAADTFDKKRQKIAKDSESVIEKLASLTVDYPVMWGVYILVLAVPVVLILYVCFKPGSPSTAQEAEKKKTDEVTEDVQENAQEVEDASAEAEAEAEEDEEEGEGDEKDEVETTEETLSDSSQPQSSQESTRKRKVRKE